MDDSADIPRRSLVVACGWAWVSTVPLALAAIHGGGAADAFTSALVLATALLPLAWAALGADRPIAELLLLGAVSAPGLALSASFAAAPARGAGLVYLATLLAATALLLRAPPRARVALAATLGIALPLALRLWDDLSGPPPEAWALLTPPLAVEGITRGAPLGPPLAALCALVALGAAAAWVARRRAPLPRAALAATALLALALPLSLAWAGPSAQALLGPHVRPGEPYPLAVRGSRAPVAARSLSHRYVGAHVGDEWMVVPTPLGAGHHLALETANAEGFERSNLDLPQLQPLGTNELLLGWVGEGAGPLAGSISAGREVALVGIAPERLALLAQAGHALDALVVARGVAALPRRAAALRAWTAAGGVLACVDASDLDAVCGPPSGWRAATGDLLTHRQLGAGHAIGPGREPLGARAAHPELTRVLSTRLRRRAGRAATVELAQLEDEPGAPADSVRRAALCLAVVALVWCLLAGLRRRLSPKTLVAGAWVVALLLALLLRGVAAPSHPTFARSLRVLVAPSGALLAQRLEVTTLGRVRPGESEVSFSGWAAPQPRFFDGLQAVRSSAALEPATATSPPRARLPLRPGGPRTFTRLDACELEGPVTLDERGVQNATPHVLEWVHVCTDAGVLALGDVAAGARAHSEATPTPLNQWRYADVPLREAKRRRLACALFSERARGERLLLAYVPARAATTAGVGGEYAERVLVIRLRR